MSNMDTYTRAAPADELQGASSPGSNLTGDSVSSMLSIFVTTSHYPGEHSRATNLAKSAAEIQGPADPGDHGPTLPSSDEWDGEVVGEVFDRGILKYRVAWEPTLEPEENLGAEMKKVWEEKKAKSVLNRQERRGIRKRSGRPRKIRLVNRTDKA